MSADFGFTKFWPYGRMSQFYNIMDDPAVRVPSHWQGPAWDQFVAEILTLLSDNLWPVWNGSDWIGATVPSMADLTVADLTIMLHNQQNGELNKQPRTGSGAPPTPGGPDQKTIFADEERMEQFGRFLEPAYQATYPQEFLRRVHGFFRDGLGTKCGTGVLKFKKHLQRPRPYQISLLSANFRDLTNEDAMSANTPAMISGHCIQGMLAGAQVLEKLLEEQPSADPGPLLQNMVDCGDRRVLAGVHYPSDNLSSWICTMRMAPYVLRPEIGGLLYQAVHDRSQIYRSIVESGNPAYQPGLRLFHASAAGHHKSEAAGD